MIEAFIFYSKSKRVSPRPAKDIKKLQSKRALLPPLMVKVRKPLSALITEEKSQQKSLLIMGKLEPVRLDLLRSSFRRVVASTKDLKILPEEQLEEVFSADNASDLIIAGFVDIFDNVIVLYRGNLDPLRVPFSSFTQSSSKSPKPNFKDFDIIDYGQTVKLGQYEAAVDALLYEFDPDFRRRAKKNQLKIDRSLGGSLRRLRLLKGLKLSDFSGVSEKQIGRIERGEEKKPKGATLEKIVKRLGVSIEELLTY